MQILPLLIFMAFSLPVRGNSLETLSIHNGVNLKIFTVSDLKKMRGTKTVTVDNDPAYPQQKMTYLAAPVSELFSGVNFDSDRIIEFKCLDGFSGPIDAKRLLKNSPDSSKAFIAFEVLNSPWPKLKPSSEATAGPFYLIWDRPELSKIVTEEWPYQLKELNLRGKFDEHYPNLTPKLEKFRRGFEVFRTNCLPCHKLNQQGHGTLGPDLNHPYSPTEYMGEIFLPMLIRDPQSLRKFPNSKMPAFSKKDLPDSDLNALIQYLSHMARTRHDTKL